jgi:hypothetical protein
MPPEPASVDPGSGNIIVFRLEPRVGHSLPEACTVVTGTYAVAMIWRGEERRFYLFDNAAKTVHRTEDFDAFLQQIDSLPEGVEVQRHDTCCGSLHTDMPDGERQRLAAALERGGRRWAHNPVQESDRFITCVCERRSVFP